MAYKSFTTFTTTAHPLPRRLTVVDPTIFTGSISGVTVLPPDGLRMPEYSPDNFDLLRYRIGKYWSLHWTPGTLMGENWDTKALEYSMEASSSAPDQDYWQLAKKWKFNITMPDLDSKLGPVGAQSNPPANVTNKWINYVDARYTSDPTEGIVSIFSKLLDANGNGNPLPFYDHVFQMELPLDSKIVQNEFGGTVRTPEAEVKPVYNFFVQPYEAATEKYDIDEKLLPNFYAFLTVLTSKGDGISDYVVGDGFNPSINTILEKQITLAGAIPDTLTKVEEEVLNNRGDKIKYGSKKVSKGQFFDKYAHNYHKVIDNARIASTAREIQTEFKNQIVPMSNLNLFTDYNDKASQFPMYVEINFSTDVTTNVAETLKDTNLSSILIKDIVNSHYAGTGIPGFEPQDFNTNLHTTNGLPFNPPAGTGDYSVLKSWDMKTWFDYITNNPVEAFSTYGKHYPSVFLGPFNEEMKLASATGTEASLYNFFKNLMILAFRGKFQDLAQEKNRTAPQIFNEKKAYNETVFYKIAKYSTVEDENGNPIAGDLIQCTYLPNSNEIDVHKFIDTQVKYGKTYIYKIYSYEMVFGTKYYYTPDVLPNHDGSQNPSTDVANNEARICIIYEPSIKLVEVPYFQKTVVMTDKPPVAPEVNVVPYRDVKDKILFLFQGNTGNYKLKPFFLQSTDETIMNKIRLSQDLTSEELVEFSNDDPPKIFEVYRTETRPEKYEDFIGKKIAEAKTDQFDIPCKIASSAAFRDSLEPNKTYYYTFRTIDNHGNFSNPSPIYQIKIVYDAGSPFLDMEIIDLSKEKNPPQMAAKKFRKYIQIKPAKQQTIFNGIASNVQDEQGNKLVSNLITDTDLDEEGGNVHLGTAGENLWGKNLKIRIVSRKSGKRIDVNLKFTHKPIIVRTETDNNLC